MITCRLMDGLGNQLFMIATTYALARRNGAVAVFPLIDYESTHPNRRSPSDYKKSIYGKLPSGFFSPSEEYIEKTRHYTAIPYCDRMRLNGWFMSEKYFIDYKEELISLLTFPEEEILKVKQYLAYLPAGNKVAVHVRRGDYRKPTVAARLGLVPKEYYQLAMEYIQNRKGKCVFIFITDEPAWVFHNIKKDDNIFLSIFREDTLDLALMTLCNDVIMGNSTFAWWGAYLNQMNGRLAIAPNPWVGPGGPQVDDIIPASWIQLPTTLILEANDPFI